MSDTERAWAAGFWDGEGSAGFVATRGVLRLQLSQVEREPIVRFCQAVECGTVMGPYPDRRPNVAPCHKWAVSSNIGFHMVWNLIGPYLSTPKREQFHTAWLAQREYLESRDTKRHDSRAQAQEPR